MNFDTSLELEVFTGLLQDIEICEIVEDEIEEAEPDRSSYRYPLSRSSANELYNGAGVVAWKSTDKISTTLRDPLKVMLDECLRDFKVSFQLNDMQLRALISVAN